MDCFLQSLFLFLCLYFYFQTFVRAARLFFEPETQVDERGFQEEENVESTMSEQQREEITASACVINVALGILCSADMSRSSPTAADAARANLSAKHACQALCKCSSYNRLLQQELLCILLNGNSKEYSFQTWCASICIDLKQDLDDLVVEVARRRKESGPAVCPHCGSHDIKTKYSSLGLLEVQGMIKPPRLCTHSLYQDPAKIEISSARFLLFAHMVFCFHDLPAFLPVILDFDEAVAPLIEHFDWLSPAIGHVLMQAAAKIIANYGANMFGDNKNRLLAVARDRLSQSLTVPTNGERGEEISKIAPYCEVFSHITMRGESHEFIEEYMRSNANSAKTAQEFLITARNMYTAIQLQAREKNVSMGAILQSMDPQNNRYGSFIQMVAAYITWLEIGARHHTIAHLPYPGKNTTIEKEAAMHTDTLATTYLIMNETGKRKLAVLFPWLEVAVAGETWGRVLLMGVDGDKMGVIQNKKNTQSAKTPPEKKKGKEVGDAITRCVGGEVAEGNCAQCGGVPGGLQVCGGCRLVAYCGRNCQKAHWRAGHKAECQPRDASAVPQRLPKGA